MREMFDIIFYKDKNGKSEILDYLDELTEKRYFLIWLLYQNMVLV